MTEPIDLPKSTNFSYTPTASLMTKTYQPKGSSQAPTTIPPLVSGVNPAARPAQNSSTSTGQNQSKQ